MFSLGDMKKEKIKDDLDAVGVFSLEYETQYGWKKITQRDESHDAIKFKTPRDAIRTGMSMGFPTKNLRIIDAAKGRKVII